jgi:hypothetical protein
MLSTLTLVSESATSAPLKETSIDAIEAEEIDALPVLAEDVREVYPQAAHTALPDARRSPGAMIPAAQAVAVAAGGFVAGAAVLGLVQRRQRRSSALTKGRGARRAVKQARRAGALDTRRAGARGAELMQIVDSRTLLVDVHLLGRPGER